MAVRISSAIRTISVLLLLFVLMYVYANVPDHVGMISNEVGRPDELISKNVFFFGALFILAITNGIIMVLIGVVKKRRMSSDTFKSNILVGLNGLIGWLNLFYASCLIFISAFNSLEKVDLDVFGMPMVIVGVLTLGWIVGLLVVVVRRALNS
jgi:hypothetical protein